MAKIKPSSIIETLSGKLQGGIFLNTSNGVILKANNFTQQPNSPGQSSQRAKIGLVSQNWRYLSTTAKNNWDAETINYPYTNRLGETAYYSGYQLFNKLNLNLQASGQGIILNAPIFTAVNDPTWSVLTEANLLLRVNYTALSLGVTFKIYASPPRFDNNQPKQSEFRLIENFQPLVLSTNINLTTSYTSVFGAISSGTFVWVYIQTVVDGNGNSTNSFAPQQRSY